MKIQLALPADYTCVWKSGDSQRLLREGLAGQKTVPVGASPFVLGRALDCRLVFPSTGPKELRCESGGEAEIQGCGLVKIWRLAPW